ISDSTVKDGIAAFAPPRAPDAGVIGPPISTVCPTCNRRRSASPSSRYRAGGFDRESVMTKVGGVPCPSRLTQPIPMKLPLPGATRPGFNSVDFGMPVWAAGSAMSIAHTIVANTAIEHAFIARPPSGVSACDLELRGCRLLAQMAVHQLFHELDALVFHHLGVLLEMPVERHSDLPRT